jgi:hypothetical protein
MATDSASMRYFRENVSSILEAREDLTVSALARAMNDRRTKETPKDEKLRKVSRTFLSNVLHGHFPCSVPFAEEVAEVIGVPLHELFAQPKRNGRRRG